MRRAILLAVSMLALVLVAPASSATATVSIKRTGFVPASVTINQDDSVTWTNNDTIDHQVVANGGSFASPLLKPGESFTRTFCSGGGVPEPHTPPSPPRGGGGRSGAPGPG